MPMPIETAIYNLITTETSISELIGDRCFGVYLPQGIELPAIVYVRRGSSQRVTTEGAIGLVEAQFDFHNWAKDYPTAIQLASLLKNYLEDYEGTVSGVRIHHTRIIGRSDIQAVNTLTELLTRFCKVLNINFSYEI